MKIPRWQVVLALLMTALTVFAYMIRWFAFPGAQLHNEMWRFLVGDLAFLCLQILLVTVFVDGVLQRREKDEMRQKLNMLIGAFSSQIGAELLGIVAKGDTSLASVRDDLIPKTTWHARDYAAAKRAFEEHVPDIDLTTCDLVTLKELLEREKSYMLGLLGNQALLEHEHFTDLLWAVTHLAEELAARRGFDDLSDADRAHLEGDVERAYRLLGVQWLDYLAHLQTAYPYLFSLAVRTNPLDPSARAEVTA